MLRSSALLSASLFLVQGAIHLLQLGAAVTLTVETYSTVRLVESYGSVGALVLSFGLPSLALVRVGSTDGNSRRTLVRSLLGLAIIWSVAWGGVALALIANGWVTDFVARYAWPIFALSFLASVRLLLTAMVQSHEDFRALATSALLGAALSCFVLLVAIWSGSDPFLCWLFARLSLEVVTIAGLGTALRRATHESEKGDGIRGWKLAARGLALSAAPVGASLVVRALVEHGPVLWLESVRASNETIAQFGFVATILAIAIVPTAIVQGVLVPRVAKALSMHGRVGNVIVPAWAGLACALVVLFGLAFATSFLTKLAAVFLLPVVAVGAALILITKADSNASGATMLLFARWNGILLINLLTLAVGIVLALGFLDAGSNVTDVVVIVAIVEAVGLVSYTAYLARIGVLRLRRA